MFDKPKNSWHWYEGYNSIEMRLERKCFSYETHIATIDVSNHKLIYFDKDFYSKTTSKYQKMLANEFGNWKPEETAKFEDGKWNL